jgi:hypothetical protein
MSYITMMNTLDLTMSCMSFFKIYDCRSFRPRPHIGGFLTCLVALAMVTDQPLDCNERYRYLRQQGPYKVDCRFRIVIRTAASTLNYFVFKLGSLSCVGVLPP